MLSNEAAIRIRSRRLLNGALVLAAALVALAIAPAPSHAAPCTPPVANEVACENTKPGAPQNSWTIDGFGDESIQGYSTKMSVQAGETIGFKIKSESNNYRFDILRLGYYGGDGARLIASNLTPSSPAAQPDCLTFSDTGLIDCGNWSQSASWTVPSNAVSGVYIAHLVRNDNGDESHITFVVRNDSSDAEVVMQTSDTTWQAYNRYGGNSTYHCTVACPPGEPEGYKGAYKVSYNRPVITENASALFPGAEYPMIRFLEANGYDVSYISGLDVHQRGHVIRNHDLFLSIGHDEYWSADQRRAMEDARDAGVSMAFLTGNTGFWRTRHEPSAAGPATPDRTLVVYKDTHFEERQDPVEWTGTWRDPRFTTPEEGVTPENALIGQTFEVNSGSSHITVPYEYSRLRMWRNTDAATLSPGQSLNLAPNTLGVEWDVDADNGFRPDGSFRLSSTTVSGLEIFIDYGSNVERGGTQTHNMTMYRAPSGARIWGAGTMQWAIGLDDMNRFDAPADRNMQQATVNMFADLGAQAATLQPGLVPAARTSDNTPPTATVNAPASAADGAVVTLTGTASDSGGGVVGGVEVSTDDGETWHLATGTTNWSYRWTVHGAPSTRVKVRATDDSGNTQNPGAGVPVTVSCPCSIWGTNTAPPRADSGDPAPVEVGLKFKSDSYGTVTGIRFYKSALNTGTHSGSLWTESGQRLAQATFTNETAEGWQTVTFAEPVEVQPNTVYVASYYAPSGHYAATGNYFWRNPSPGPNGGAHSDSPPLHAVRNSGGTLNGMYSYSSRSVFPTASFGAANYWVDPMFTPAAPPGQATNVTASEGGRTSANVTWSAPASGGTVTNYEVTPYVGAAAQTPKTVPGTTTTTTMTGLTTGTTYTFRVRAYNPNGSGPTSAPSNAVTPSAPVPPSSPTAVLARPGTASAQLTWTPAVADGDSPITSQTVTPYTGGTAQAPVIVAANATSATITGLTNGTSYTFKVKASNAVGSSPESAASNAIVPQSTIFNFVTPNGIDYSGGAPLEVGMKFRADHDGFVTGVRFYKGTGNTGMHVGNLWTESGTRLAQATFTSESASGWQAVAFASPVAVTAGTTYVASYYSPEGGFTGTVNGLTAAVSAPPLRTVANSVSANGVYAYGPASNFPTATYNATNYWVDVMYALPSPGQVTALSASEGGRTTANLSWTPPSGGGPVSSYKITPFVGANAQTPRTVAAPASSASVAGLTTGTTYTFRVQAVNANGPGPMSAASNAVTPSDPVAPMAPTNVAAKPATRSARVTWTPPASDGDSPITGQTVTPYNGSSAGTPVQVGPSADNATVGGLDNGTSYTFKVTATNAVGTGAASAASPAVTPQATIFDFAAPASTSNGSSPLELGVKFRATFDGAVTGIRFYKHAGHTGTHTGSLWSELGTRLAQATFTGETASGWQHVTFSEPVPVTTGTTYVASYFSPSGRYSLISGGLSSAVTNGPLQALGNSTSPNGVYAYGATSRFPTGSFGATNYMVDVLYAPAGVPGTPTAVTATPGSASATVSWTAPSSGGPVRSYEITPYIGSQAQPSKTITGTPPSTSTTIGGLQSGTSYRFTVRAANPTGNGPESSPSAPVTPLGAVAPGAPTAAVAQGDSKAALVFWTPPANDGGSPITGYTVTPFDGATALTPVPVGGAATSTRVTGLANGTAYTFHVKATTAAGTSQASNTTSAVTPRASIFEAGTPATNASDAGSIELGVKFRADVAGSVTGLRFFKAAANTGAHVGSLWAADGTLLARAPYANESPSGWQALTFGTPVTLTPGATYVASYFAPNGRYSVTGAAFANTFANPPLYTLANSASPNGVYSYRASPGFPTSTYNANNYWVDVLFAPGSP